jgi:hypothetical protein
MVDYDVLVSAVVLLSVVSFLLYGRARVYGVSAAAAKRTVIEIWAAAVAAVAALAIASRLVPAARLVPWGVLQADARGRLIAVVAGAFCVAAGLFALSRARRLMETGQLPGSGPGRSGDAPEDEDS